jgi:small subunit ribosomal protein S9
MADQTPTPDDLERPADRDESGGDTSPQAEQAAAAQIPADADEPAGTAASDVAAVPSPAGDAAAAAADLDDEDDEDDTPRVKPAIPGMDLEVDIVSEGEDPLTREEREAAEAEAAAAAEDDDLDLQPIATTIDLAADARYRATGKRKTAVARVILKPGTGAYSINGKELDAFFPRSTLQRTIRQPLETVGYETRMDVVARMHGGGVAAQAGALRHGISRALLEADPNLRGELKRRGFLTRDARVKERKKAGLKKARKRPQFSKR